MRLSVVGLIVVTGLLVGSGARAEDPCAADVKQFCANVQVGGGRVQDCLNQNEARLSPACRTKRAETDARFRQYVEELGGACQHDAARLCGDVKPGRGRVVACLLRQQDDLSGACRTQTDRFQDASATIDTVRDACRADVERLCGETRDAGPLVECIQTNRENLSETCRNVDPEAAMKAAEFVDAVTVLTSQERAQEAQQILQGLETVVFSRSQVLLQVDSFHGLGGMANANRVLFNPQLVFGERNQFAFQLRVPVLSVYPYAPDRSAETGLGAVTTAFAWGFFASKRVHQFLSLGLQWISPEDPPVGSGWAVTPAYAISIGVTRFLSLTGQVAWVRSFASKGYAEVNGLVFDPILVLALPGRTFLALDTKLGWNLETPSFVPVMKGVLGIYLDRRKSLAISSWYQTALTDTAKTQTFGFGVGVGLTYFFDW